MMDLIYNQHQIPREQWRYGLRSSAAVGCGWIATYNALRLLSPLVNWRWFEPGLRNEVHGLLTRVAAALPRVDYSFIGGRLVRLLDERK